MGFFGSNDSGKQAELESQKQDLKALQERWDTFLNKLEIRYNELLEGGKAEGRNLFLDDSDHYHGAYNRFKSAWVGQLNGIIKKAEDVWEEQMSHYRGAYRRNLIPDVIDNYISDWYEENWERWRQKEEHLRQLQEDAVVEMEEEDLELKYQEIIALHNAAKDKFTCVQCGAPVPVNEIYFIPVYLTCPSCATQNTFTPATKVQGLELLARPLAEQRSSALRKEYEANCYNGREDSSQRFSGRQREFEYYQKYQRAVFDEMNKILPSLKDEQEKFYNRLITDYKDRL